MEARLARVESDVAHLVTDMADVKAEVRSLRDRIDAMNAKLSDKIDDSFNRLNDKFEAKFQSLQESISAAKIWALVLYIALAAGMFGTMARGFGWI